MSILCCAVLSHIWLFATPWTVAYQTPLSMEFSGQECWSGLPFPSTGDLPHPWIVLTALASPALAGRFFTTAPLGKHSTHQKKCHYECETDGEKVLKVVKHHNNLERESKVPYGQHPRGKQGNIPCHVGFLITGQTDQFWNVSKVKQRMAASLPRTECPLVCAQSMVIDVFPGPVWWWSGCGIAGGTANQSHQRARVYCEHLPEWPTHLISGCNLFPQCLATKRSVFTLPVLVFPGADEILGYW